MFWLSCHTLVVVHLSCFWHISCEDKIHCSGPWVWSSRKEQKSNGSKTKTTAWPICHFARSPSQMETMEIFDVSLHSFTRPAQEHAAWFFCSVCCNVVKPLDRTRLTTACVCRSPRAFRSHTPSFPKRTRWRAACFRSMCWSWQPCWTCGTCSGRNHRRPTETTLV